MKNRIWTKRLESSEDINLRKSNLRYFVKLGHLRKVTLTKRDKYLEINCGRVCLAWKDVDNCDILYKDTEKQYFQKGTRW